MGRVRRRRSPWRGPRPHPAAGPAAAAHRPGACRRGSVPDGFRRGREAPAPGPAAHPPALGGSPAPRQGAGASGRGGARGSSRPPRPRRQRQGRGRPAGSAPAEAPEAARPQARLMPELPEVESQRRRLQRWLKGRRITAVRVFDDPVVLGGQSPRAVASAVRGRRVRAVGRRGKHLWLELDPRPSLAVHFGLTGWFSFYRREEERPKYWKIELVADDAPPLASPDP